MERARKAIILAAGRGSRMGALTDERPKCLVPFRGKTLLQWQLDALRSAGLRDIALVRGYRGELLETRELTLFANPRWEETQMVTSLACAREWLERDTCIVSYSDIFYGTDTIERLMESPADLAITYDPAWHAVWRRRFADPLADAETFRIDENGRVLEIGQRPGSMEEIQGQYMGLLQFRPPAWAALQEIRNRIEPVSRDRLHMTGALQMLIHSGFPVHGVPCASEWGEVDSEDDLRSLA